jgi:glycosyltransferase involved in cell wall biosynthesis
MAERRVLWVLGAGDIGGVGRHALDVIDAGVPDTELSFLLPPGPLAEELALRGAHLVPSAGRIGSDVGIVRSVATVRAAIATTAPVLVHSHLAFADVITILSTRGQVPTISTEHGIADVPRLYNAGMMSASAKRRLHRARLRRTAGIIAVSEATRRSVTTQWRPPASVSVEVIHNGVDPVVKRPGPEQAKIGVLSRLAPEKRIDLVIEALELVRRRLPGASLSIAGTGSEQQRLAELVDHLDLGAAVEFVGHETPSTFLDAIDLLVQASAWENCSYSLLDAVVAGRGVVATSVGGNPEILGPANLVSPMPTPEELADAIAANLGHHPTLPLGWPSVADMTRRIADFYDRILRRPPSARS